MMMLFNTVIFYVLFSNYIFANFSYLNHVQVPNREYPEQMSHYILPNELTPSFFGDKAFRGPQGLMVSVGTLRSLVGFSWAKNITHLWMADIDNEVVEFNKKHLLLLHCIAQKHPQNYLLQRLQYFANFHGYDLREQDLEEYKNALDIDLGRFRAGLLFRKTPLHVDACWNHVNFKEANLFTRLHRHSKTDILFGYNRINQERYYWEDNALWQKLIDAVEANKIAVSRIDIVNDFSLVADFIQSTGLLWGIFDVSNVPSFLTRQDYLSWAESILHAQFQPKLILMTEIMHRNQFNYLRLNPERFKLHHEMVGIVNNTHAVAVFKQ